MKNKLIVIFFLGILIRGFLAATTYHSDLVPFYFAGKVISQGNVANFYDYLGSLSPKSEIRTHFPENLFNYPPLVYFFLGPISYILALPFGENIANNFVFNVSNNFGNLKFNIFLMFLKIPFFVFDVGILILLYKFFDNPKDRLVALTLWTFNPVNLFATYMMGQFDIIPTFLTFLALYLAVKRKRLLLSAVILGLAASFKIFPLMLLVPLCFLVKDWAGRIKLVASGLLVYVIWTLPFIASRGFRSSALVAAQTTKSFYAQIPISGGEAIILFPLVLIFFYLVFLERKALFENLWERFFILLLTFFVFTHYHPQWFLWLTPFFILDLIKSEQKHWPQVFLSLLSFFGLLTFFDPGLTVRLFSPLVPSLSGLPGIWEILRINNDINFSRGLLHTVFVSSALYYLYTYFPKKEA